MTDELIKLKHSSGDRKIGYLNVIYSYGFDETQYIHIENQDMLDKVLLLDQELGNQIKSVNNEIDNICEIIKSKEQTVTFYTTKEFDGFCAKVTQHNEDWFNNRGYIEELDIL